MVSGPSGVAEFPDVSEVDGVAEPGAKELVEDITGGAEKSKGTPESTGLLGFSGEAILGALLT